MATKAELEIELAKLRRELDEHKRDEAPPVSKGSLTEPDAVFHAQAAEIETLVESLNGGALDGKLRQMVEDTEKFAINKPILTAIGVFFAGYIIGNMGRRS